MIRNGIRYNKIVRNGNEYVKVIRNGVVYMDNSNGIDSNLQAVINFANANSIAVPANLDAHNQLVKGLKRAGIFQRFDLMYLFAGNSSDDFRLINIVNPNLYKADLFGGVVSEFGGFKGNNVNGQVQTNFNPVQAIDPKYQRDDAARCAFVYSPGSATGIEPIDGLQANNQPNCMLNGQQAAQRVNQDSRTLNVAGSTGSIDFRGAGLKVLSRSDSNTVRTYNDGAFDSGTASSSNPQNSPQLILSRGGTRGAVGVSFYSMGGSLTDAQMIEIDRLVKIFYASI